MMRIITGRARGVKLATLEGEQTRPTAERAKEAVFSMLQFEIEDRRVLDLFAGSGQLGLEAVSRGAGSATLVDRSREAIEVIKKNCLKTRLAPECEVICADYKEFLRSCHGKKRYDLVFLDPPYAMRVIPSVLERLVELDLLNDGAKIVCETGDPDAVFDANSDIERYFSVLRQSHYGVAHVTVLEFIKEKAE